MYRQAICAVFVNKENKILLGFNSKDGVYTMCQGGIEEGETPKEACKREVKEELGFKISDEDLEAEFEEIVKCEWVKDKSLDYYETEFIGQELKIFKIFFDEEKMNFSQSNEFENPVWIYPHEIHKFNISLGKIKFKLEAYKEIIKIIGI
ncbi:NUDIX domain-containing protein [Candidatus Gracilibacteria bacterium]|nr:NUDIX domain-containing protein [Candidatus Gracilibacteria bacterium]NUJ98354.1 NUDIX domain-containing protein [Candidatus Gracilibacteria bacterium]NUJ99291.1 NUDIX domain-containing protein [Candidatus Gracilibacteria bacterium]